MMNSIKNIIKKNRFVRGLHFLYINTFGYCRKRFGHLDDNVKFTPPMVFANPKNVYIYGDVQIGPGYISALNARFVMKRGCAVAGGLRVQTGNHARVIGKLVGEVKEKDKPIGYDKDVVVEEDVWIGANVTLLFGITIGRGATIAAGAVVTKSIPPYCICGGIPARFIKFYWTIDEILQHESLIYPESERFKKADLEHLFKTYES